MRYFLEIVLMVFTATFVGAQRQGDLCVMAGTIQPGVCRHIMRCSVVLEAAFNGLPYQVCASPENRLIVCCPWVPGQETRLQARCQANTTPLREGDNCTMADTGKAGVCSQFGNCPTAMDAASKGKFPQVCALEGNVQIICCPLVTVAEGDQCTLAKTGRAGKCLRMSKCPVAVEAALKGITPQICAFDGSVPVVCCEGVVEGDNCTMLDTGRAGVCRPFANCQTAKEAAYKGISPQICALEDRVQIVCCPPGTVIEGDNCTVVETGRAGVCRPFAICQTAKEAASKGIFPQTCDVEGTVQTVCCPLSTVVEGDNCSLMDAGRVGVCRPFANCQTAKEASYKGIFPQTCDVEGSVQIVCCPPVTVIEGDNCTMLETGRAGVCTPFANCQTAKEAAYKGISPQICALEDRVLIVCCPPVTVIEGSICLAKDTKIAGVYKPFANCQTAMKAASEGTLPQIVALEDNVQIVCCPLVIEGDNCSLVDTGRVGVCRPFANCQTAKVASYKGIFPQTCDVEGSVQIVCCPPVTVIEGDNCTVIGTGKAGVCRPFATCQTAKEASSKGILPQTCDVEGTVQTVCCPLSTVVEGDNCSLVDTGRVGVCRPFANCQTAKEASYKGIFPQTCDVEGSVQIVCCPPVTVIEGDNCTMLETGRVGVCTPFANCQTAKEAAYKGISPQICALEDRVLIVCCPPVTVIEGSICLAKDTKKAGVYKPFANCQTAMKAASEGTLPQISALEDNVQIVCCPLVIEGSNCTLLDTGMAGVCRSFANCRRAKKAAGRGVVPQKCDSTDNESELVCCAETDCPPLPKGLVTQLPISSKAADYCIELAEKIYPCQETPFGWTRGDMLCPLLTPDPNIVYHKTPVTTTAEAPYYGRIGSGQRGDITWPGSPVSLVSDQWVLCTAYAIEWIGSSKVNFVGLGGTLTPRYNPDEIYGVTKQYIHPLYNGTYSKAYNNIALLQLDREVKFTSRILPACLHTGTPLPDSGFILTEHVEGKMSMQRVSQEECSKAFPTGDSLHPAGIKQDVEICSRPVNTTGKCENYYGGSPLTLPNGQRVVCTHLLVGLVSSWTRSSCTYTNTRISAFIPWIEGIVWPESGVVV